MKKRSHVRKCEFAILGTGIYDINNLDAAAVTPRGEDEAPAAARAASLARRMSAKNAGSLVRYTKSM